MGLCILFLSQLLCFCFFLKLENEEKSYRFFKEKKIN